MPTSQPHCQKNNTKNNFARISCFHIWICDVKHQMKFMNFKWEVLWSKERNIGWMFWHRHNLTSRISSFDSKWNENYVWKILESLYVCEMSRWRVRIMSWKLKYVKILVSSPNNVHASETRTVSRWRRRLKIKVKNVAQILHLKFFFHLLRGCQVWYRQEKALLIERVGTLLAETRGEREEECEKLNLLLLDFFYHPFACETNIKRCCCIRRT